ncbi:11556_t:CDS:2, partial [Funneliformis caledonium]
IYDEENISETIKIVDFENSDENLDDDFDFNENLLDSYYTPKSFHTVSQNQYKVLHMENKENEVSNQLIPIDPVLVDITNKVSLQEEITNHEILREAARRDLENYTEKMGI